MSGAYASLALNAVLKDIGDDRDRAYITKLVYGVIDDTVTCDYIIARVCAKPPKPSVKIVIRIGLYCIRHMDIPLYAATDNAVELTKAIGKGGVSGFVNAALRKGASVRLPQEGELSVCEYLSVTYGYPLWMVRTVVGDYGEVFARSMLSHPKNTLTHIRPNLTVTKSLAAGGDKSARKTKLGYYVTHSIMKNLAKNTFFVQSYASMLAVRAVDGLLADNARILDLCSAPGGKAV